MHRLSIATALLGLAVLPACVDAPTTTTSRPAPIVGGVDDTGDPAVVAVDLPDGLCTGTVISPHVVLTAAHCIEANTSVRFANTDSGGTVITATSEIANPGYNANDNSLDHDDIGLITLSQAAPVDPIPFNTVALEGHLNESTRIIGFGTTAERANDAGTKRMGTATLQALVPAGTGGDTETTNNPQGTCYGDSGGPNLMQINGTWVVAGVTVTGTDICGSGLDVNTRVDGYKDWIQAYVTAAEGGANDCSANGTCNPACGASDPDCATQSPDAGVPAPDAGDGSGTGTGTGSGNPNDGNSSGGCSTSGGGATWLLGLLLVIGLRRRHV